MGKNRSSNESTGILNKHNYLSNGKIYDPAAKGGFTQGLVPNCLYLPT